MTNKHDDLLREAQARTAARLADPARPICAACNAPRNIAPWGEHFCRKDNVVGGSMTDFEAGEWTVGPNLDARVDEAGLLEIDEAEGSAINDDDVLARARDLFPALTWAATMRDGHVCFEGRGLSGAVWGVAVYPEHGNWRASACPDIGGIAASGPILALEGLREWLQDGWQIANDLLGGSIDHDLQRLQPKAGDVLVCTIAAEGLDPVLLRRLQQIMPSGVQLVILPQGATLQALDDAMLAAAGLQRIPPTATRPAEIRDGEDSSSACARACGEDEELQEAGWIHCDDGTYTRRGWTVEIGYLGDGVHMPNTWIARRPEGGTLQGGWPAVYLACKAVNEVIDRTDREEVLREAGDPASPLPPDAPMAVLVSQFLLALPGCETESTPTAMVRAKPLGGDRLLVKGPKPWGQINVQYVRAHDAPLDGPLCWRFVTTRDPGLYSDPLTTVLRAVDQLQGNG